MYNPQKTDTSNVTCQQNNTKWD